MKNAIYKRRGGERKGIVKVGRIATEDKNNSNNSRRRNAQICLKCIVVKLRRKKEKEDGSCENNK